MVARYSQVNEHYHSYETREKKISPIEIFPMHDRDEFSAVKFYLKEIVW